eukprot:763215-Hanusia_phi.AAC.2
MWHACTVTCDGPRPACSPFHVTVRSEAAASVPRHAGCTQPAAFNGPRRRSLQVKFKLQPPG